MATQLPGQPLDRRNGRPLNRSTPIPPEAATTVVRYLNNVVTIYVTSYNIRGQLVARDLAYYRETDGTKAQAMAKAANQSGDTAKMVNVTLPVVMPHVETAVAYQASVFLTGFPIFGVVAPPDSQEAIGQMEAIIGDNSIKGAWPQQLMKTLRNGFKYDLGAVEVVWEKRKSFNIGTPQLTRTSNGTVQETQYQGNFIKDLDPYNILLDTRVSPDRNHIEGEFAGYTEMLSKVATKMRMDNLDPLNTMQFREALESPTPGYTPDMNTAGYFMPSINPDALLNPQLQQQFSWDGYLTGNFQPAGHPNGAIRYQQAYEYTTLYARILPSDFKIPGPNRNHVQIWKFIIINRSVCIFAELQTNAHGYLPIIVCKPSNDGMGWQSKSLGQNAEPYQFLSSSLMNSGLESQRRKVYDRILYDPLRIKKSDIDNVSSVARIPVKNNMYSKDIGSAIYVAPYRDEGVATIMEFGREVAGMADQSVGQNKVSQGQFQKGNKTRREFDTTMGNANSRQQMTAIGLEYSFFTPIKDIIKSNILQFQPPATVMNAQKQVAVEVDPEVLRQQLFSFKMSDGLLPTDKLVAMDVLMMILQTANTIPDMRAKYDIMGMLTYFWVLQGAHWLEDFERTPEEQQQYMQLMQQAAQASGQAKTPEPEPRDPGELGAS